MNTVLCIDDDPIALLIAGKLIEKIGFAKQVIEIGSVNNAFDYLGKQSDAGNTEIDLILLDLNMPLVNGWDFLEKYEQNFLTSFPDTRIAVLTSSVDPSEMKRAHKYHSVIGFYSKPLTQVVLQNISQKIGK